MRNGFFALLSSAVLALGGLIAAPAAKAEVRLPAIFGSHMMLQQEKPVAVWGWAEAGETVTVEVNHQKQTTQATAKGEWRVTLPPMKAGGPVVMTITGKNTLALDDVLIGEVWLCSGQSNMEMGIELANNGAQEIAAANYPQIRLFLVPKKPAPLPQRDVEAKWVVCSPQTVAQGGWAGFSAVGYFFGRDLHKELKVPVGLIESNWGGTAIEPWIAPEGFASVPALAELNVRVQTSIPGTPAHQAKLNQALAEHAAWQAAAKQALEQKTLVPALPAYPELLRAPQNEGDPMALYNGMIYPLIPFTLRGYIWYQGESNHLNLDYDRKMEALVGGWRTVWNDPTQAFYYVQIAPFQYNEESHFVPDFWLQQNNALSLIPNSGIAITNDIGDLVDIHPRNKQEVGRRLALLALNRTYGKSKVVCVGPKFKDMQLEGGQIRVNFADTAGGLATRDGKAPTWFEVIDAQKGGFVKAEAKIEGNSILLSSPEAPQPIAMRYAWSMLAQPNLMNKAGLPASAFRAGEVPKRDRLEMEVTEASKFELVYDLDLATLGQAIKYTTDKHASITRPFDRVAYFLELGTSAEDAKYVYVSLDAFTADPAKLGLPTAANGAFFQQPATNLNILSNVADLIKGTGQQGNLEIWPTDYSPANSANVRGASVGAYDFGDEPRGKGDGYGCLQIHNTEARQTIFAINDWRLGPDADVGIGSNNNGNDWTFSKTAKNFPYRRLRVLVHYK
jgi:sialate O-acetylesterase